MKKGNLADYQCHFDAKYGEGAHKRFLKLAKRMSLKDIGKEFSFSKQWASEVHKALTGGKRKPYVAGLRRLRRSDVTPDKILEVAKKAKSVEGIARALKTSSTTIVNRAKKASIKLPDGRGGGRTRADVTAEQIKGLVERGYRAGNVAKELKTSWMTIYHRAKEHNIALPKGFWSVN